MMRTCYPYLKTQNRDLINSMLFCTQMLDIRHDNLSHFIGATVDPPNICIVSEFYSRGSLQVSLIIDGSKTWFSFVVSRGSVCEWLRSCSPEVLGSSLPLATSCKDLFLVVPGSGPWLRFVITNRVTSCQLGLLTMLC